MSKKPHILVLAYVYPPDAGSGTFRTLYFMNNLSKQGVKISVITVEIDDFHPEANVDDELVLKIHPDITVIRCSVNRPINVLIDFKNKLFKGHTITEEQTNSLDKPVAKKKSNITTGFIDYIKNTISGLLTCPDQHVGWIPNVLRKGKYFLRHDKIDYIYATGGPWSCVLAGALLHKITGIPLLVDFRDPWVSNPNFHNKPALIQYLETKMEAFVIKNANTVIANTDELRIDFIKKYSRLNDRNIHTITNGFEKMESTLVPQRKEYFSLVHAGELYMSRNPANLLEAIEHLIKEGEINKDLFRIIFVGGISIKDSKLNELLQSQYLENVIVIYPRVSHNEAISYQLEADALLLIQPDFPLQIPRKLFEYISLQKPVLAITEECSATGNIIRNKSLGVVVENNTSALKAVVLDMYRLWENNKLMPLNLEEVSEFQNEVLATKLEILIKEMAGN